jgi:hypothetical protein
MEKKVITQEEFFKLKEMFSGSVEDVVMALEIYNTQYKDKEVLDQLMAKALMFDKRLTFVESVKFDFLANTQKIYAFIHKNTADKVYLKIMNKIMK